MKVTEAINKFVDDITLWKNSSFLNSTFGTIFRGLRLRDLREFFVGLVTPKISYDRNVWSAALYRPTAARVKTGLSKIGICQDPGPKVDLFPEPVDPTPEEAQRLLAPTLFATEFSYANRKSIQKALPRLERETDYDDLEFLSKDAISEKAQSVFENLPDWMKDRMKDGVFHDPTTGNAIALFWDDENQQLHASFCGTSTMMEEGQKGQVGFAEQIATDMASYAARHIPSSHKQAADVIGACKQAAAQAGPDSEVRCYGFSLGGGLALYAGTKHGVRTHTVNSIALNWRMQCDLGEARMNRMVRDGLLTNVSIEGDPWSDPVGGSKSVVCKVFKALEKIPLAYPRPRTYGKTYRIKWKDRQDSYIKFAKPKGQSDNEKEPMSEKVSQPEYIHCNAPKFVQWRMLNPNMEMGEQYASNQTFDATWQEVKIDAYYGHYPTDLDAFIPPDEREKIAHDIYLNIMSHGKRHQRPVTPGEAIRIAKDTMKTALAQKIAKLEDEGAFLHFYPFLSKEMRKMVDRHQS